MIGAIRKLLRRLRAPAPTVEPEKLRDYTLRRWESAETHRLNSAHWKNANGQNINADLLSHLESLRTRSAYEAANNPIVAGVIATYQDDVVGQNGPMLQVQSDSESYNERLEEIWADWWDSPELNGQLSGPAMLRQWIYSLWINGELLGQIVTGKDRGPVRMRVLPLHPRRLGTPPEFSGEPDMSLGIRFSKEGRPRQYMISDERPSEVFSFVPTQYSPIPADLIIHEFDRLEPHQVRGVPWLAPVLQVVADLRDFDHEVLQAARLSANHTGVLQNLHQDAPFLDVNSSTEIEAGQMATLPAGWEFKSMAATQPSAQYKEYRHERIRELGRPVNMPLMKILLSSAEHNFSSARFDNLGYVRGIQCKQAMIRRRIMNRLAAEVAREAELSRELPARPKRVKFEWTWPGISTIDPQKEDKATTERLTNYTETLAEASARSGGNWEDRLVQIAREVKRAAELGLEHPAVRVAVSGKGDDGESATEEADEKAKVAA